MLLVSEERAFPEGSQHTQNDNIETNYFPTFILLPKYQIFNNFGSYFYSFSVLEEGDDYFAKVSRAGFYSS